MKRKLSYDLRRVAAGLCAVPMVSSVMPSRLMSSAFTAIVMAEESSTEPQKETIDEKEYYDISSVDDLLWAKEQIENGNININLILKNDIDLSGTEWTSIGKTVAADYGESGAYVLNGTFDGNGHTISGISASGINCSLFYAINSNGVVKNLTIKNCTFNGKIDGENNTDIGAVTRINSGKIINCKVIDSTVSGWKHIGGIVGTNEGEITDCINEATVSGETYIGGIAGKSSNKITDCANTAAVSAEISCAGGIVGELTTGTIERCSNTGKISAIEQYAGGITGDIYDGAISKCINTGNIESGNYAGGIAGLGGSGNHTEGQTISLCISKASLNGSTVGGIVGFNTYVAVSSCYTDNSAAVGDKHQGTETDNTVSVSDDDFASGEVCYLINQAAGETVFYQTLGKDDMPVLDSTHKRVSYADGKYINAILEVGTVIPFHSSVNFGGYYIQDDSGNTYYCDDHTAVDFSFSGYNEYAKFSYPIVVDGYGEDLLLKFLTDSNMTEDENNYFREDESMKGVGVLSGEGTKESPFKLGLVYKDYALNFDSDVEDYIDQMYIGFDAIDESEFFEQKVLPYKTVMIYSSAKLNFSAADEEISVTEDKTDSKYVYKLKMPKSEVTVSHEHEYISKLSDYKNAVFAGCVNEIDGVKTVASLTANDMVYNPNTGYTGAATDKTTDWVTGLGKVSVGDISINSLATQYPVSKTNGKYELPVGSYNASATAYVGSKNYELSSDFEITAKDITDNDITVDISSTSKAYDGKEPDFTVTATYGDTTLTKDKDYEVTIEPDGSKIGSYIVTVSGKGNYKGTKTFDYDITTAEVSENITFEAKDVEYSAGTYSSDNLSFSADSDVAQNLVNNGTAAYKYYRADKPYDNADLKITDSIFYGADHYCGDTLKLGHWLNYGVRYTAEDVGRDYLIINCYTVKDGENYSEWKEIHLTEITIGIDGIITGKDTEGNDFTGYCMPNANYAVEEQSNSYMFLWVRHEEKNVLNEREQFIASVNMEAGVTDVPSDAGKYLVEATIHDNDGNYNDVVKYDTFEITPASVSVSLDRTSGPYSVYSTENYIKGNNISGLKGNDRVLAADRDSLVKVYNGDEDVTDTEYLDAGTYTLKINEEIAAKYPNYEFTIEDDTLTVNPLDISADVSWLTFDNIEETSFTYNGKEQSPNITGTNSRTNTCFVKGTDYTVTTGKDVGSYTAVVTGTGNYTGTREFGTWSITAAEITDVEVDAPITYTGNDDPQKGHIRVFGADADGDGEADLLTEGVDYEIRYVEGSLMVDPEEVFETAAESIKELNIYTAIVKGKGNYTGYTTKLIRIAYGEADASHFDVTFNNGEKRVYDGISIQSGDFSLAPNENATPAEAYGISTMKGVEYAKLDCDSDGTLDDGDILRPCTVYKVADGRIRVMTEDGFQNFYGYASIQVDSNGNLVCNDPYAITFSGENNKLWKVTNVDEDGIPELSLVDVVSGNTYTPTQPTDAGIYVAEIKASGRAFDNVTVYKVFEIKKINVNISETDEPNTTWGKLIGIDDIFNAENSYFDKGKILETGKVYKFDNAYLSIAGLNLYPVNSVTVAENGKLFVDTGSEDGSGYELDFNGENGKVWVATASNSIELFSEEDAAAIEHETEIPLSTLFTIANGDTEYDFTDSSKNNAGEYTITANTDVIEAYNNGDNNYNITVPNTLSPLTVTQKSIEDEDVTVTIEPESYDYNGNVRTVRVNAALDVDVLDGTNKNTKEYTLALGTTSNKGDDGYYSGTTSAYKAGEWTVNVTGLNNFKDRTSKTWNVNNAEFGNINITNSLNFASYYSTEPRVTDEFVKANTQVYNVGNTLISSDDEELILTVAYYAYDETTGDYTTALDSAPVDAGKYKVTVTAEYPNHNPSSASVLYEIKKAGVEVTFNEFDLEKPLGYTDRNVRYTYKVQNGAGEYGEETEGTLQIAEDLKDDYELTIDDLKALTDIYDVKNYEYSLGENYTVHTIDENLTAEFVNSDLDVIYSAKTYEDPEVIIKDAAGRTITDAYVVYDYYEGTPDENGDYNFERLFSNDKPVNVGHYKVYVSAEYNGTANPNILDKEFDIKPAEIAVIIEDADLVKPVGYKDGTIEYTYTISSDKDENGELIEHEGSIVIPLGQTEPYTIKADDFADIAEMINSDNYKFILGEYKVYFSTAKPVSASAKTSFVSADEPYVTPEITILDENGDVYNGEYTLVGTDEANKAGVYSETVIVMYNGEPVSLDFNWIVTLKGDVNLDGKVDDTDATLVLKYIGTGKTFANFKTADDNARAMAAANADDTNEDIDMLDVIAIINNKTENQ
ncbi:MAG: hypothetical protein IJL89_06760 [Firmicutes bacterium]|nr:hypothetical protein [Bacillota bacterium]